MDAKERQARDVAEQVYMAMSRIKTGAAENMDPDKGWKLVASAIEKAVSKAQDDILAALADAVEELLPGMGLGWDVSKNDESAVAWLKRVVARAERNALEESAKHFPVMGDFGNVVGCEECDWKPMKILQSRSQFIEHICALRAKAGERPGR
jgi:hypothetical protein